MTATLIGIKEFRDERIGRSLSISTYFWNKFLDVIGNYNNFENDELLNSLKFHQNRIRGSHYFEGNTYIQIKNILLNHLRDRSEIQNSLNQGGGNNVTREQILSFLGLPVNMPETSYCVTCLRSDLPLRICICENCYETFNIVNNENNNAILENFDFYQHLDVSNTRETFEERDYKVFFKFFNFLLNNSGFYIGY